MNRTIIKFLKQLNGIAVDGRLNIFRNSNNLCCIHLFSSKNIWDSVGMSNTNLKQKVFRKD
jgi:hypothetical protein